MADIGVGKEILSNCSKCKLILAHIIVTMKTATVPDKVQCKTCKSTQSFKDPSAKKKKTSVNRVIKSARSGGKKSTETVGELWSKALGKSTTDNKEYSMKGSFQTGDVINHPTFGQGIVEKLVDDNKIEVLFQDDYRTLLHKK
jgi:DNA-directed RNA polymerase subunit M/transcription elongation factor TFIIS